jgi:hypothetical protein
VNARQQKQRDNFHPLGTRRLGATAKVNDLSMQRQGLGF